MTKVMIDRELLERVVKADASNGASSVDLVDGWKAMEQIRAILAAPRQPEGEFGPDISTKHGYPAYSVEQHQRAIAELREECERLRNCLLEVTVRHFSESLKRRSSDKELEQYLSDGIAQLEAERDTLLQQLAERDAEILEQCRLNGMGAERELKLIAQRDKLAELLRYARRHVAATRYPDNDEGDYHERRRDGLLRNINAALAEVGG